VLVSALSDQQSIINGLSVKADAYVTKPFDTKVLQLTISNLVESRLQLRSQLATLNMPQESLPDAASELDLKPLAEMKTIIERSLGDNDFTVDTLAYDLRVSRTTLYNKVKVLTGNTPSDFIRIYRINKAKTLLRERRYAIVEVAEMVAEIVIADIFLGVMDMLDVSADCMTISTIRQLGGGTIAVKIPDSFFMAEIPQKSIVSPLGQIGLIVDISDIRRKV
jgi:AraC-like DNA-binding protein